MAAPQKAGGASASASAAAAGDSGNRTDVMDAGAGLVADIAVAGMRYARNNPRQAEEGLDDVLERLEAHRGLGMGLTPQEPVYDAEKISGYPCAPGRGQALYASILDDMRTMVDKKLGSVEAEEAAELAAAEKKAGWCGGALDWTTADCRKLFLGVLVLLAVLLAVWEMTLSAVERPLRCGDLDTATLACVDAREAVHAAGGRIACDDYTCAAPWAPSPGSAPCLSCRCGGHCDACEQCVCAVQATGAVPAHHVCMEKEMYTEGWGTRVRLILLLIGACVLFVGMLKWGLSVVVNSRRSGYTSAQKTVRQKYFRRKRSLKNLQRDILLARVGGAAWRQEEPPNVFLRRVKAKLDPLDYQRFVASLAHRRTADTKTMGEEATEAVMNAQADLSGAPSAVPAHPLRTPKSSTVADAGYAQELLPQPSASGVGGDGEEEERWMDENDLLAVEAAKAFYARVLSEMGGGGRQPSRRRLYNALVPGEPPAGNLTELHVRELLGAMRMHAEPDEAVDEGTFVREWLDISGELQAMEFDPEDAEQGGAEREDKAGLFQLVRSMGMGGAEESSDDSSDTNEAEGGNAGMVKSLPYLLALLRGAPPPTKEQAAHQQQGILAAVGGLQRMAGESRVDDIDDESDEGSDEDSDTPLVGRRKSLA